jgi:hypothetical protein
MKKLVILVMWTGMIGSWPAAAGAAPFYWDSNGAAEGAGSAPDGTWGVHLYWNAASNGTGTTGTWTNNHDAVFSAGTDATGATIMISGTQAVASLTLEEGVYSFSGTNAPLLRINNNGTCTVASAAAGSRFESSLPIELRGGSQLWTNDGAFSIFGPVSNSAATRVRKYGTARLTIGNTFDFGNSQLDIYSGDVLITASGKVAGYQTRLYGGNLVLGNDTGFSPGRDVVYGHTNSRILTADATARILPANISVQVIPTFESSGDITVMGIVRREGTVDRIWVNGPGTITLAGIVTNFNNFSKYGGGTLVIDGLATVQYDSRVYAGTLLVNGVWKTLDRLDVGSTTGGTLGGTGTIVGAVNILTGGTLSPGSGSNAFNRKLTVEGNLRMANGATYLYTSGDMVDVSSGQLRLDNTWTLQIAGPGFAIGGSLTLFTYNTLYTPAFLSPAITVTNLGFVPGTLAVSNDTANSRIVLHGLREVQRGGTVLVIK